jgi:chaperonin GroEL
MPTPAIVFGAEAHTHLLHGFTTITRTIAATLGPSQGAILSSLGREAPESLTDSATIAKRIMALPDRRANVGAMLARNLVWRQHQLAGDGGATALVLAHAILKNAHRYAAAGMHVMALRTGIQAAATAASENLRLMARPVTGECDLAAVAYTATGERRISTLLGEIYDILGPDASVTIEELVAPYLEREYHHGGQWLAFLASPYLMTSTQERVAVLSDAYVALYAGDVETLNDIVPLLEILGEHGHTNVLLVANKIAGDALTTLVQNHQRGRLQVIAATMRRPGDLNRADFADLGALTGARVLDPALGESLRSITLADLGHSERVKASSTALTIMNRRDAEALRTHIATLRARISAGNPEDAERIELRQRIGRLSGGVATLKIGATTAAAAAVLQQRAAQGSSAIASALRDGIVMGGGVALLDCVDVAKQACIQGEAAYGASAVAEALAAPLRRIAQNAGQDPDVVLAAVRRAGPGYGYDATAGQVLPMNNAGIYDSVGVLATAISVAASAAAMVLTTDTLVLKRTPELSTEP